MASSQNDDTAQTDDLSDIKRKLVWRMAIAGLMIAALLGGLALFDRLTARNGEAASEAQQFTEPVPVQKKTVTQPLVPAEPPVGEQAAKKDEPETSPEASAAPVQAAVQPADTPSPPQVAAEPSKATTPRPSGRGVPVAQPAPSATAPVAPAPAPAAKAPAQVTVPAQKSEPLAPSSPLRSRSPSQPALPTFQSGYVLQAGVFSDPGRAEELHARLSLEGIPSSIEARVHVGPFKTRAEADAAHAKMKALGIDSVMLPSRSQR